MAKRKRTAAGGIVFDLAEQKLRLLVIRQASHGGWVFPKGHLDKGESPERGGVREVAEETGIACEIVEELGITDYTFTTKKGNLVEKTVYWYLMRPVGRTEATHAHEVLEQRWVPAGDAAALLSYDNDRELLERTLSDSPTLNS